MSSPVRARSVLSVLSALAALCWLIAPLSSCSKDERLVLIEVKPWLAPASFAVITTQLGEARGRDFRVAPSDVAAGQPIGVYIPSERSGPLYIEARFHDEKACRHGRGETRIDIDGKQDIYNASITATAYAQPLCSCSAEGFCWENPIPQGYNLQMIWGSGPTDIWAVGDAGTILRSDGGEGNLTMMPSSTTFRLTQVGGTGRDDVWIVGEGGTVLHYDGTSLKRIATNSSAAWSLIWLSGRPGELWTAGGNLLARCTPDGCSVQRVTAAQSVTALTGNAATGEVFAVDGSSRIVSCGSARSCGIEATVPAVTLSSVWAGKSGEVLAGGSYNANGAPVVMRKNGANWVVDFEFLMMGFGLGSIHMLTGSSGSDVWAAGYDQNTMSGLVTHWDGMTWARASVPPEVGTLNVAWLNGPGGVSFMSRGGGSFAACSVAGVNPPSCSVEKFPLSGSVALWGSDSTNLWAVGYGGLVARGQLGRPFRSVSSRTTSQLQALWGSGPDDVWAVGGATRLHYQDGAWEPPGEAIVLAGGNGSLHAIWGRSREEIWAVGSATTILNIDPATGRFVPDKERAMGLPSTLQLLSVWGSSDGTIFAVGSDTNPVQSGPVIIARTASAPWQLRALPAEAVYPLAAVWGAAPDDVWAVGYGGTILHYDGQRFSSLPSGSASNLTTVWGSGPRDVWAAGSNTLLHYDGIGWSLDESGPPVAWSELWGTGKSDIWAVASGKLLHYDGTAWSGALTSVYLPPLLSVFGTSPLNVRAVGNSGAILVYDP
jgi:hypothetical protein